MFWLPPECHGAVTNGQRTAALKTSQNPGGEGGTFTGGGAAVVFKVGAVLAFIVLGTLAEIVAGAVVALGTVLAGIGLAIIDVQLRGPGAGEGGHKVKQRCDYDSSGAAATGI